MAYGIVALCVLLLRYQPRSVGIEEPGPLASVEEQQNLLQNANDKVPDDKTARLAAGATYSLVVIIFGISALLIWGVDDLLECKG